MIKGVNKRIIEINNPQSIYFEKAIFYLKPNVSDLPDSIAKTEVQQYIALLGLDEYPSYKNRRRKIVITASAMALLSSAAYLIISFLH